VGRPRRQIRRVLAVLLLVVLLSPAAVGSQPAGRVLAPNTPAAQGAKRASATIPIVMARTADPVHSGLVCPESS
jgi:ABC-type uncharacterized transport system substrate-binding protein